MELHHFSDASLTGYGACSYLRVTNHTGRVHAALIMAKSRLAPIKQLSVPRLELCAAVVAVKLDIIIRRELELKLLLSTSGLTVKSSCHTFEASPSDFKYLKEIACLSSERIHHMSNGSSFQAVLIQRMLRHVAARRMRYLIHGTRDLCFCHVTRAHGPPMHRVWVMSTVTMVNQMT